MTEGQFDTLLKALNSISKELRIRNRLEVNKIILESTDNKAEKNEAMKKIGNAASIINNF